MSSTELVLYVGTIKALFPRYECPHVYPATITTYAIIIEIKFLDERIATRTVLQAIESSLLAAFGLYT